MKSVIITLLAVLFGLFLEPVYGQTPAPGGGSLTVSTAGLAVNVTAGTDSAIGNPTYGRVTTGVPAYTNNTYNALSLDTSGNLRVAGSFSAGAPADTVGMTTALNGNGVTASVATAGQNGCVVTFAAGSLVGTVIPVVSLDGGTTWTNTEFITGASISGPVGSLTNPSNNRYSIIFPGSVTNCGVQVSAYTSGTVDATVRAVASQAYSFPFGQDPNGFWRGITVGLNGRVWNEIRDASGVNRGANVNASNQLSVSVDNTPAVTISGQPVSGRTETAGPGAVTLGG